MDITMARRAVQIDEQSRDGGGDQRGLEGSGDLPRHEQCTEVETPVGRQPPLPTPEQSRVASWHPVPSMLAGDHHAIAHGYQFNSGSCLKTVRTPSLQFLLNVLK